MAGVAAKLLGGLLNVGQTVGQVAPLYGQYAAGLGMQGVGYGMQGAAHLGGTKFGQSAATGLGLAAGKGIYNVLTGNGPIQRRKDRQAAAAAGGCSCSSSKPKPSCEEKCAYGRMMSEKCRGCKGYTGKGPGGYKRRYGRGGYGSTGGTSGTPYRSTSIPYGGSKPRVSGRQYRRNTRVTGRQQRRTNRQNARQQRRANRRN